MSDTQRITDYLARVVQRGQLDEVIFGDAVHVAVPRDKLASGLLGPQETSTLFVAHDDAAGHGSRGATRPREREDGAEQEAAQEGPPLSVVISSVSLEQSGGTHSGLLLTEAKLFRDGRLEPVLETASSPWIPAERLSSPMVSDREVMVGDLNAFWAHSRRELGAEISQTATLAQALELGDRMFQQISGSTVHGFAAASPREARIEHELCFIQELDRVNAAGALLDLYDYVAAHGAPPLLERMCQGWRGDRLSERAIHQGEGRYEAMRLSCGSMGDGFPLTPSQRRAVHAFLTGEDGDVTAVSGPPGTGKTTMLQAVVANLLTRRALDGQDAPVIVGTSTNNQAVTNIISSFSSVTKNDPGTLDLRWLPSAGSDEEVLERPLQSLAVYCPAKSRLAEARKTYLVEQTNKSETYTDYSDQEYLQAARTAFVRRAVAHFGHAHDIGGIQRWIAEALTELDQLRLALTEEMDRHGASPRYAQLCARAEASPHLAASDKVSELAVCRSLEELDDALDGTLRYAEFWLAVHFYEARWLLTEDFVPADERFKTTATVMTRYWPQAAALTPCFVMTAYQVPRYFGLHTKKDEPPNYDVGRIDLLIVDEAGQVDTPIGLPAFTLATRALVVGDEKQLAPVWSLDNDTDREVAESAGISSEAWLEDLHPRGLSCSPRSSLMRAAAHASRWCYDGGAPGLLLTEHFRCHPQIIGFCNDLLYNGLLEAKRSPESSPIEGPAFLFTDVPGSHDVAQGTSRQNETEAAYVARWIVQNYSRFRDLYIERAPNPNSAPGEDELIAVVTPFSAQARLVTRELRRAAVADDAPVDLPAKFAEKITVGTAHRLQGAERPVVLFSAVYGQNSGQAGFIDANPELMNVAVSRAKDLFIVMAAANRWGNGKIFEQVAKVTHRTEGRTEERADDTHGPEAPRGQNGETDQIHPSEADQASAAPAPPEPVEQPGATTSVVSTAAAAGTAPWAEEPLSLTALVKQWREEGLLDESDAALSTTAWNQRLAEAGVLVGEKSAWEPTALAARLGVVTEERLNAEGTSYTAIVYTARMRRLLEEMYGQGLL